VRTPQLSAGKCRSEQIDATARGQGTDRQRGLSRPNLIDLGVGSCGLFFIAPTTDLMGGDDAWQQQPRTRRTAWRDNDPSCLRHRSKPVVCESRNSFFCMMMQSFLEPIRNDVRRPCRRGQTFSIRCIMCIVGLAGASELSSAFSEPSMLGGMHNNGVLGLRDMHVVRNGAVRPLAYTASSMPGVPGTSDRPKLCETGAQKGFLSTSNNKFVEAGTTGKKLGDMGAISADTLLQHVQLGSLSAIVEAEPVKGSGKKRGGGGFALEASSASATVVETLSSVNVLGKVAGLGLDVERISDDYNQDVVGAAEEEYKAHMDAKIKIVDGPILLREEVRVAPPHRCDVFVCAHVRPVVLLCVERPLPSAGICVSRMGVTILLASDSLSGKRKSFPGPVGVGPMDTCEIA
jgi:hypothetical protein